MRLDGDRKIDRIGIAAGGVVVVIIYPVAHPVDDSFVRGLKRHSREGTRACVEAESIGQGRAQAVAQVAVAAGGAWQSERVDVLQCLVGLVGYAARELRDGVRLRPVDRRRPLAAGQRQGGSDGDQ